MVLIGVDLHTREQSVATEWAELFGEPLLASAALDRLTHGAHFVEMTGQSFRAEHTKKQVTARRARGGH
jgi:DNA replication protein DnaC